MNRFSGPGPGEPVSRTDLRELSDGVSNLYDQFALNGINRDDTLGSPMLSVPKAQVLNVRPLSGSDGVYTWEGVIPADLEGNWNSDGTNWGTEGISPLIERNGNALTIGDVVEATLDESLGVWICDVGAPADVASLIPATLIRAKLDGVWRYSYTLDEYGADEVQTEGAAVVGTVPFEIVKEHTQTQDGINPDIYTIRIIGATDGSYTLKEDALSTTVDIDLTANDATINALLSVFTCASSMTTTRGEATYTHVFTSGDPTASHDIVLADSSDDPLMPDTPHYPAVFRNSVRMDVPVAVHLKNAFDGPPEVTSTTKQEGDGDSDRDVAGTRPTIISLEVINRRDGAFRLLFDTVDPDDDDPDWQVIERDDDATDIQTKLSTLLTCTVTEDIGSTSTHRKYTITVTADNDSHVLRTDLFEMIGRTWYVVVWSNGNECTGPIGGVDPTGIDGYGPTTPTAVVTPSGSSVGPWTIIVKYATAGTYQVKVDGGSPVNTAYSACPTLAGFTVTTNSDGSCHVVGDGGSHTLEVFGGKLRNDPDYAVIVHLRCAKLEEIADCVGA